MQRGYDYQPATVSRVMVEGDVAVVEATHTWPDHVGSAQLAADDNGHLYVLRALSSALVELIVLDDQTLDVLATLPLDSVASNPRYANGRLLLDGAGGTLVVDVRAEAQPRVQAFLTHPVGATTIVGDQLFSYGHSGIRALDTRTENSRVPP